MAQRARRTQQLEEFSALGDELAKYVGTLKLERKTREEISSYVHEVEEALSKPMKLDARALQEWFPLAQDVVLEDGDRLMVTTDGKTKAYSVLELEPEPYKVLVKEVGALIARLMAQADTLRALLAMPVLQADLRESGKKLAIFGGKRYDLLVSNGGGPARKLKLTMAGDEGAPYGPYTLRPSEKKVVALRNFERISASGLVKVVASFEDSDGRAYTGRVQLEPGSRLAADFDLA